MLTWGIVIVVAVAVGLLATRIAAIQPRKQQVEDSKKLDMILEALEKSGMRTW